MKCEYVAYVLAMSSQHRTHTRHQFLERKWLGDVIVRTNIQPGNAVPYFFFRRQHDDRCIMCFAYVLRDGHSIQARQHDVENHYIGLLLCHTAYRFRAGSCYANGKTFVAKSYAQELNNLWLIVYNQNGRFAVGGASFALESHAYH